MIERIISFIIELLPIAAGFVPATLYQVRFKKELGILYSILAALLIGYIWWWGLYDTEISKKPISMIAIIIAGSYLLFRFDDNKL